MRLAARLGRLPKSKSVRGRLFVLAALAAIPIVVMAGLLAQETFRETGRAALGPVYLLQGQAIARYLAATASAQTMLAAVLMNVERSTDCGATLQDELARVPGRFSAIARFDTEGKIVCQAAASAAGQGVPTLLEPGARLPAWFEQARGGSALTLGRATDGRPVAAIPAAQGGVLAAELPPDWFANVILPDPSEAGSAVWLLNGEGAVVVSRGAAADARPTVETLANLDASGQTALLANSADVLPYAYAATQLADGWRLITAYRATREHDAAQSRLALRMAELAVLIAAGLAAVVLGAEATFGKPLRRLSAAVTSWQSGGAFDPGPLTGAPNEVHDLAHSFALATSALREREAQLARAQEKQELLMLEVHHRVKNNLQIIASLLNLQASRIRVPEARAEFQAARDRVRALATLHRHLYSEGDLHTINMRSFLMELCGQLFQAIGETEGHRIGLSIEAPELRMSSDQAVPLALIVTEAVTNSVKYAFPGGRHGHISVRLTEHDDVLDLEIKDDGVGIPAGKTETETGTRDGIGLQLIRGFSRQLGASLEVEEGQGTRYAVRLPLRPSARADAALDVSEEAAQEAAP
jgi:two-component sensor histidine kinase